MKFVVEAASIADWLAILVSEEKKGRKITVRLIVMTYHDQLWKCWWPEPPPQCGRRCFAIGARGALSPRGGLQRFFFLILMFWIISHFEAQQKKKIEKFCWMKYEKYQAAFGFDKWPVLPVHLVVETCGDIIQPYFPPPNTRWWWWCLTYHIFCRHLQKFPRECWQQWQLWS